MGALTSVGLASWDVMLQLAPWLLLGAAAAGALHGLLPAGFVHRQLSGRWGVAKAVLVGVPLPLCSCGVIPTGLGLKKDGASDGAAVGFLTSTPQTGVDSVLVAGAFLGWPFAAFKVAAAAVTGLAGGWLTDALGGDPGGVPESATDDARPGLRGSVAHGVEMLHSIWGWLVFGVVLSAVLTVYLPPDAFTHFAVAGGIGAMLAMLLVSLPLYVCATASVPIAAALVAAGMPTGAALVFLMAGPATNVATLGAVYRGFGRRTLMVYLSVIVVGSIAFGLLFDGVLGPQVATGAHHHEHTTWWAVASSVVLVALITWFAASDLRARFGAHRDDADLEILVEGMTCNGCVRKVQTALEAEAGVDAVQVELNAGVAPHGDAAAVRVVGPVAEAAARAVIRSAGYTPV